MGKQRRQRRGQAKPKMAAVAAPDQAGERAHLGQELLKAVTANLKNRAQEAAVAKGIGNLCNLDGADSLRSDITFIKSASKKDDDHGSSHSGTTCIDDGSETSWGDGDWSIAAAEEGRQGLSPAAGACVSPVPRVQPVVNIDNYGGTWYPAEAPSVQQQHHHDRQHHHHLQQQQQQQQQQTPGGVCLQNFGGTFYPVATSATMPMQQDKFAYEEHAVGMCYSPAAQAEYNMQPKAFFEYGENIAGFCPARQTDYVMQSPSVPFVGDGCEGTRPAPDSSVADCGYSPRTMSYGGEKYPYWMPQ